MRVCLGVTFALRVDGKDLASGLKRFRSHGVQGKNTVYGSERAYRTLA